MKLPTSFHSDTNTWLCFGPFCWQNPCSSCNSGTDLVVLEYVFFNFVPTPNISLRFTRFRRIHVNWPAVVLKSHCHTAKEAFLLDVCCLKWPRSFFCSCFLLMIVHLRNLFLLSTPVARILLTSRWVSRQKNVKWSSTNISRLTVEVKHSISGRTTFSPNLHLVEQETLECNNTIARFHVITRI